MMNVMENSGVMNSILVALLIALSLIGGLVIVQKSWRAFLRWKTEQYHLRNQRKDVYP